jgi:hypothetical protein
MNFSHPVASRLATAIAAAAALCLTVAATPSAGLAASSARFVPVPPRAPASIPGASGPADVAYHYAAGEISAPAGQYGDGASGTFQVEHPKQVPNGHSLAEIAVEDPAMDYSYIEAGWIVQHNSAPHLFIFWWLQQVPECYNQGCGYVQDGPGIQPGAKLKIGSTITLTWQHQDSNWWLIVNGKKSGYYPDSQWSGAFTQTGFAQTFGEVAVVKGRGCHDMGDGKLGSSKKAATITDVAFTDGPTVSLVKDVDDPTFNYTMALTGANSMGYGGPGLC